MYYSQIQGSSTLYLRPFTSSSDGGFLSRKRLFHMFPDLLCTSIFKKHFWQDAVASVVSTLITRTLGKECVIKHQIIHFLLQRYFACWRAVLARLRTQRIFRRFQFSSSQHFGDEIALDLKCSVAHNFLTSPDTTFTQIQLRNLFHH